MKYVNTSIINRPGIPRRWRDCHFYNVSVRKLQHCVTAVALLQLVTGWITGWITLLHHVHTGHNTGQSSLIPKLSGGDYSIHSFSSKQKMEQPGTQTVWQLVGFSKHQLTTKGASGQSRAIREDIVSRSFLSCLVCWLELIAIKVWNTCRRTL